MALDATTGKQIWSHPLDGAPTNRGFNYWESKDRSDRRLIFAVDSYLQEVNALTGVTINTFGNDGRVNLREGLGRDPKTMGQVQSGSPGHVFENLIILGSAPGEIYTDPPGDLRAYDVLTGKNVWTFHTIPRPGEYGYDTWPPDAWKYAGGANTWSEFAIDEKRGIAYFPLGSPTYDLYGADRDRREPVRQLPACARCANRQTDLALPDRPSRSLGLRPGDGSEAAHGAPQRKDGGHRRAARKNRFPVCL